MFFLWVGGSRSGTGFCMDPTTGIAVVSGAQVTSITGRDIEVLKVARELESTLYQSLKVVV